MFSRIASRCSKFSPPGLRTAPAPRTPPAAPAAPTECGYKPAPTTDKRGLCRMWASLDSPLQDFETSLQGGSLDSSTRSRPCFFCPFASRLFLQEAPGVAAVLSGQLPQAGHSRRLHRFAGSCTVHQVTQAPSVTLLHADVVLLSQIVHKAADLGVIGDPHHGSPCPEAKIKAWSRMETTMRMSRIKAQMTSVPTGGKSSLGQRTSSATAWVISRSLSGSRRKTPASSRRPSSRTLRQRQRPPGGASPSPRGAGGEQAVCSPLLQTCSFAVTDIILLCSLRHRLQQGWVRRHMALRAGYPQLFQLQGRTVPARMSNRRTKHLRRHPPVPVSPAQCAAVHHHPAALPVSRPDAVEGENHRDLVLVAS